MTVDALLFWGRILFLAGLYLFILYVVLTLRRDLRAQSLSPEEAAPGELVIVAPAETGLRQDDAFPLMTETLLGRSADNTIQLADSTVSGRHARLLHGRDGWTIEDLGSRNGVVVNGRKVNRRAHVKYGEVVSLGGVSVKLVR